MLLSVVVTLLVVGVLLWAFNAYVTPIDPTIKKLINVVVIVATILWLIKAFGLLRYLPH